MCVKNVICQNTISVCIVKVILIWLEQYILHVVRNVLLKKKEKSVSFAIENIYTQIIKLVICIFVQSVFLNFR
jgi:hypothetical protein